MLMHKTNFSNVFPINDDEETRRKMTQDLGRDKFLELSSFYNFVLSDPAPAHIETCSVLKFGQTIIQMAK